MTDPTTPISAVAEALEAATPGPWEAREGWNLMPPMRYEIAAPEVEAWSVVDAGDNDWGPAGGVNKKADAHLIANAPTWLAQLLAALEEAQQENARLREALRDVVHASRDEGLAEMIHYMRNRAAAAITPNKCNCDMAPVGVGCPVHPEESDDD